MGDKGRIAIYISDTWPFAEQWSFSPQTVCCCKQKTKCLLCSLNWTGPSINTVREKHRRSAWTLSKTEISMHTLPERNPDQHEQCQRETQEISMNTQKRRSAWTLSQRNTDQHEHRHRETQEISMNTETQEISMNTLSERNRRSAWTH